jgi:hypothetical protein
VVKLFWRMLEQDFSELERRALLLFWTGSSVPPRGGFRVDAEYDEVRRGRGGRRSRLVACAWLAHC